MVILEILCRSRYVNWNKGCTRPILRVSLCALDCIDFISVLVFNYKCTWLKFSYQFLLCSLLFSYFTAYFLNCDCVKCFKIIPANKCSGLKCDKFEDRFSRSNQVKLILIKTWIFSLILVKASFQSISDGGRGISEIQNLDLSIKKEVNY